MKPVTILYLDDDSNELSALQKRLKPNVVNRVMGFASAPALYAFLDAQDERSHLVILVDIMLGDTNGYEVIRELRARYPDLSDSPILALTASEEKHLVDTAELAGADAYIRKPASMEDLITAIGRPGWYQIELVAKD